MSHTMGQKCDGSDRSWAGMETAKPLMSEKDNIQEILSKMTSK